MDKIKKIVSFIKKASIVGVVAPMALSLTACGGSSTANSTDANAPVNIIVANAKGEIDAQFKQAAVDFTKKYPNIHVEVDSAAVGDTLNVYDKLTASGKTVTLSMFDPYTALNKYKNVGIDLSNQKWTADTTYALKDSSGKVVGFPFAVEGMGLVYNQAVLDKAVGGSFDPFSINTQDKLKALLDQTKASGVQYPVAYQTEAWSVGNHYSSLFLDQASDPNTLLASLKAGTLDLAKNDAWNGYYNTLDLLTSKNYNKYGDRPLGQYYDLAHVTVGKGQSAILFNGDWAFDSLHAVAGSNFGFMPVPVDNNPDNPLNNKLAVGPTQVFVINKKASAAQQAAAEKFLDWFVYDPAGQDFVVNKAQVISAFKSNPNKVTNPLGVALSNAIQLGKTMPFSTNYINASDWPTTVGPEVQKYIAKQETRDQLAKYLENYFQTH
jgi:raffinose/stachyose/melibiose transport system substrate-binding protein